MYVKKSTNPTHCQMLALLDKAGAECHTIYQTKLRCNISTLSSVNRKHFALPRPSCIGFPNSFSVANTYSSNSSSSSPGGPPRLKNAHSKNSFTFSLLISDNGAPRNHFCRYACGSSIFSLHNWNSSCRSSRVGGGGWTASFWRYLL